MAYRPLITPVDRVYTACGYDNKGIGRCDMRGFGVLWVREGACPEADKTKVGGSDACTTPLRPGSLCLDVKTKVGGSDACTTTIRDLRL